MRVRVALNHECVRSHWQSRRSSGFATDALHTRWLRPGEDGQRAHSLACVLDTDVAWLTNDEYVSAPDPPLDSWPEAQLPPETPLPSCPERSVGLSLPLPISARLDLLVALAERAGERTSRKEVVAACILGAPDGAEELVRWLHVYRRSPADSLYTSGSRLEDLELARARPGPRPRPWRHRSPAASP